MKAPKQPLLVVAGPTASGKTALAIALAKACSGEVVSADSMQIYQGIGIASACPTMEERQGIPHHLLDYVPLTASYSVAQYAKDAKAVLKEIYDRGRQPILCGGTGLYIAALTDNICYEEQDDKKAAAIRTRLQQELAENGEQAMWDKLYTVDPTLAAKLHIHDRGRIIRALEVFELTGVPMSQQQARQKSVPSPFETTMILLDFRNRKTLYDRINRRVNVMMQKGLLEETAAVLRVPSPTAQQAIGSKELRPYFDGECTLQEALECMKRRSRQYAKRQLSWFRRIPNTHTFYVDDYASFEDLIQAVIDRTL